MLSSWKTTLVGVLTLLATIIFGAKALMDNDPTTIIDLPEVIGAIMGIVALFSRDNDKTSEEAGAKTSRLP